MNTIQPKEVLSNYQGSEKTYEMVAKQIKERFGEGELAKYDPYSNCLTFKQWQEMGFRVRKGQKSLRSMIIVEKTDDRGNVVKKYPRTVHLFYYLQVEKISSK